MTDLDQLGRRHRELLKKLDDLRRDLADAIRAERAATSASYAELMSRSGYQSIDTIRGILDPKFRAQRNKDRRRTPETSPD